MRPCPHVCVCVCANRQRPLSSIILLCPFYLPLLQTSASFCHTPPFENVCGLGYVLRCVRLESFVWRSNNARTFIPKPFKRKSNSVADPFCCIIRSGYSWRTTRRLWRHTHCNNHLQDKVFPFFVPFPYFTSFFCRILTVSVMMRECVERNSHG